MPSIDKSYACPLQSNEEEFLSEEDERNLELIIQFIHDNDDLCDYCRYKSDCPHGIGCAGGEPIYPPCAGTDPSRYLNYDAILRAIKEDQDNESEGIQDEKSPK